MAVGLVSHQKQLNKSVLTECYQDFAKKLLWLKEAKLLPLDPHQALWPQIHVGELMGTVDMFQISGMTTR